MTILQPAIAEETTLLEALTKITDIERVKVIANGIDGSQITRYVLTKKQNFKQGL